MSQWYARLLEYCIHAWNPLLKKDRDSGKSSMQSNEDDQGMSKIKLRGEDKALWIEERKNKERWLIIAI